MLAAALALAVASAPALAEDGLVYEQEPARWRAWGCGGALFHLGAAEGATVPLAGAELGYDFGGFDLGVLAQGYRFENAGESPWDPVILARLEQRFETRRGLEATLTLGIGGGRNVGWRAWYQVALGARLIEGPLLLGAELGFEQDQLLRLALALGLAF